MKKWPAEGKSAGHFLHIGCISACFGIRAGFVLEFAPRHQRNAILSYRKTKDIYTQYRESGWSPAFYREHKAEIEAHKKAQAIYSAADGKLPTLAELSEEFDRLLNQKREDSEVLSQHNTELRDLRHIKTNLDTLLSDEDYEADLHNHAIPSEPDQHRSCESVER